MSAPKTAPPNTMLLVAKHLKEIERKVSEADDHTHPSERTKFSFFVRLSLWSNKIKKEPRESIASLDEFLDDLSENVLCDNSSELWYHVQEIKSKVRSTSNSETLTVIDLISNSSGSEAFLELCLVHFLTLMLCPVSLGSSGVKFRIHNKSNINSLLAHMAEQSEQDSALQDLALTWKSHTESGFWQLFDEVKEIPTVAGDFYSTLKESSLIVIKGEAYYRKLVDDPSGNKLHPLTPFRVALKEFRPAPLVALRAIKSEVVIGIDDINTFMKINNNQLPRDWVTSGDYGLIQFEDPSK